MSKPNTIQTCDDCGKQYWFSHECTPDEPSAPPSTSGPAAEEVEHGCPNRPHWSGSHADCTFCRAEAVERARAWYRENGNLISCKLESDDVAPTLLAAYAAHENTALRQEVERLQRARIGDTEIIGRWQCQAETAEARVLALGQQLEADRTTVASGVAAIRKAVELRQWLTEGRGDYEWNDDNWHQEFAAAAREILESLRPLETVAANWKDCPKDGTAIADARLDLKARVAQLEADLEATNLVNVELREQLRQSERELAQYKAKEQPAAKEDSCGE